MVFYPVTIGGKGVMIGKDNLLKIHCYVFLR